MNNFGLNPNHTGNPAVYGLEVEPKDYFLKWDTENFKI